MTIRLTGNDQYPIPYPGVYGQIDNWLALWLQIELGATDLALGMLESICRDSEVHKFSGWNEALESLRQPLIELTDQSDIGRLARHAAEFVLGIMDLTGANSARQLERTDETLDDHARRLIELGRTVPPAARNTINLDKLPAVLEHAGITGELARWQAEMVVQLVHHPVWVARRPQVRPATTTTNFDENLMLRLKTDNQTSAVAGLTANVIPGKHETLLFATNSGSETPVLFKYPTGAGEQITEPLRASRNYYWFHTSGSADHEPTPRQHDAEKKILEAVDKVIFDACVPVDRNIADVSGVLELETGIRMCASCYLVALQFMTNFPGLTVTVHKQVAH
jgi:hypothetical protein